MKYESSFKSEADGLEISVMALIPDKKPYRAVVQLVHGMSEHKERYIPFMPDDPSHLQILVFFSLLCA